MSSMSVTLKRHHQVHDWLYLCLCEHVGDSSLDSWHELVCMLDEELQNGIGMAAVSNSLPCK